RAVLNDPVVSPGRLDELPPLPDVVGKRLFDGDILPRLAVPDAPQRMPVIRRGEAHRIDFFVVENPPHVVITLGTDAILRLKLFQALVKDVLVDVTDRCDLNLLQRSKTLQMVLPPAVDADYSYANGSVEARPGGAPLEDRKSESRAGCGFGGVYNEFSSIDFFHSPFFPIRALTQFDIEAAGP